MFNKILVLSLFVSFFNLNLGANIGQDAGGNMYGGSGEASKNGNQVVRVALAWDCLGAYLWVDGTMIGEFKVDGEKDVGDNYIVYPLENGGSILMIFDKEEDKGNFIIYDGSDRYVGVLHKTIGW